MKKKFKSLTQLTNTPEKGLYRIKNGQLIENFDVLIVNKVDGKIYKAKQSLFNNNESLFVKIIIGDDSDTYIDVDLIDKTIILITTDSAVKVPSDFTFTTLTGTIQFISNITNGTIIQIIYK